MNNDRIASLLSETSLYMELAGENPFKIRSFRRAAEVIARSEDDCARLAREGRLTDLRGVGKGIAREIEGLLTKGALAVLEDLKARIPAGLVAMTGNLVQDYKSEDSATTLLELEGGCQATIDTFHSEVSFKAPGSPLEILSGIPVDPLPIQL